MSNEAHCIKVASDFLSVEAIPVCEMLAGEFRQENLRHPWKDDVLQLNFQLYCAWLSLQRPLEDSRSPFAFTSQPSTSGVSAPETGQNPMPQIDSEQPVRKKARLVGSDKRCRYRCNLCPPDRSKHFLDHGLRSHL